MLPSSHSHRRVEDVGHKEGDAEGDVGLDQIQNLGKEQVVSELV